MQFPPLTGFTVLADRHRSAVYTCSYACWSERIAQGSDGAAMPIERAWDAGTV